MPSRLFGEGARRLPNRIRHALRRRVAPFEVVVDEPRPGDPAPETGLTVRGWLRGLRGGSFGGVSLVSGAGLTIDAELHERPDLPPSRPGRPVVAFRRLVGTPDLLAGGGEWSLAVRYRRATHRVPLDLPAPAPGAGAFAERKAAKLARLRALLACPRCRGALRAAGPYGLACRRRFLAGPTAYDFLDAPTRAAAGVAVTDNVSSHGYDAVVQGLIAAHAGGAILDAGAGLRPVYLDEVVNLDVVAYPSTDVVAAGEALPFADASFDLVLSVAVLEHVRDPFACAAELVRVLRPGGTLFCAVPFLQPVHAYPGHYYNMTAAGLVNLFGEAVEVTELGRPAGGGHPICAVGWILDAYRRGLPPALAERFGRLSVAELVELAGLDPAACELATALSPEASEQLACGNYIVATRRPTRRRRRRR
jgi:SAM-dependent methyltransferase